MFKLLGVASVVVGLAGAVAAQEVRQVRITDELPSVTYPVEVLGSDGRRYECRRAIVDVDGTPTRFCRGDDDDPGVLVAGSLGPEAGAFIVALVVVATLVGDDTSTTTTSTSSSGTSGASR